MSVVVESVWDEELMGMDEDDFDLEFYVDPVGVKRQVVETVRFLDELKNLGDREKAHVAADRILCALLRDVVPGGERVVEKFEALVRWCA